MTSQKTKLSDSVTPSAPSIAKTPREVAQEKLKEFIEEETRLVRGRFRHVETPGGSLRIQVKKYPGIPMFDQVMMDGEVYEIPLYVARHLNGVDITAKSVNGQIGSCSYPVHGFKWNPATPMPPSAGGWGPNGEGGIPVPIVGVAKRVRRFGFESLDFTDGSMVA